MGAADLRESFNAVASPAYTCQRATLTYERHDGAEMQILTFYGTAADGTPFEQRSGALSAGVDVNAAARATAQQLLDKGTPQP